MSLRLTVDAEIKVVNLETERNWWACAEVSISQACQEDKEIILTIAPCHINFDKHQISSPLEVKLKLESSDYQTLRKLAQ